MEIIKPYYQIKISASDCHFDLRVNDIPIFLFNKGANLNSTFPINHCIDREENRFTCRIMPLSYKNNLAVSAKAYIKILVNSFGTENKPLETVSAEAPSFNQPDTLPPSEYVLSGFFKTTGLFRSMLWDIPTFILNDTIATELFFHYRNLFSFIMNKDIETMIKFLNIREDEYEHLFYEENRAQNTLKEYISFVENSNLQLYQYKDTEVFPKQYGNNKLCCLELKNGKSPLAFINRKARFAVYIPVYFCKDKKNNSLIPIR